MGNLIKKHWVIFSIAAVILLVIIVGSASGGRYAANVVKEKETAIVNSPPVGPAVLEADKKRLAELKTKFDYKYDEFEKKGWYTNKSQAVSIIFDKKLLRVYVNDSGYAYLESQYYGDDWIFHTKVAVKIGDAIYETDDVPTYDPSNETTNGSGSVWENVSYLGFTDSGIIKAIAESGDTPVKVRFEGQNNVSDITLAKRDQQAIKDSYELSELIKKVGDNN